MGPPWEEAQTPLLPCLHPPPPKALPAGPKNLFPALCFHFLQQNGPEDDAPPPRTPDPPLAGCLPPRDAGSGVSSPLQMRKRKRVFQRGEGV